MPQTEAWLRGKINGIPDELMPVAHSLVQAKEELDELQSELTNNEEVWISPGNAARIGFHILHIGGSLDRLFAYARGEALNEQQIYEMKREKNIENKLSSNELIAATSDVIDKCLEDLSSMAVENLYDLRTVGKKKLPSTVAGLLFHAAEHTTRHIGQIRTTLKIIRGLEIT